MLAKIKNYIHKRGWRKLNSHNNTVCLRIDNYDYVSVGKGTYGGIYVETTRDDYHLVIGNYCSIGSGVAFILSSDHDLRTISTFPFSYFNGGSKPDAISKGDITIDDDVWIGHAATILSGVHIGQGAVIAAGTVVTKDIPPYAIVGGVPAKIIKYRFDETAINELLKIDYSKLTTEMITEHLDEFHDKLTDLKQIDWLPKK